MPTTAEISELVKAYNAWQEAHLESQAAWVEHKEALQGRPWRADADRRNRIRMCNQRVEKANQRWNETWEEYQHLRGVKGADTRGLTR